MTYEPNVQLTPGQVAWIRKCAAEGQRRRKEAVRVLWLHGFVWGLLTAGLIVLLIALMLEVDR